MKLTFSTVLEHNVCVFVDGAESMTEEQISEAIADGDFQTLWVENPCLSEVISNAYSDFDMASASTDVTPLTTEEKEIVRTGNPEVSYYS